MHYLIQHNGSISPELCEIFKILNCPIYGKELDEVYTIFQQYGRKKNQERWQLKSVHENKKDLLVPIFKKLGMVQEILPRLKSYLTIIILGGNVGRMRVRIHFFEKLWKLGIKAQEILFLAGERLLSEDLSEEKNLFDNSCSSIPFRADWSPSKNLFRTEAEVIPLIWDQIICEKELRNMPFQVISTPVIKDSETQKMRRSNTADTIQTWVSQKSPKGGVYMAISNNPFIPYQREAIYSVLKREGFLGNISIETVGPPVSSNLPVASYLDALFTLFRVEYMEYYCQ